MAVEELIPIIEKVMNPDHIVHNIIYFVYFISLGSWVWCTAFHVKLYRETPHEVIKGHIRQHLIFIITLVTIELLFLSSLYIGVYGNGAGLHHFYSGTASVLWSLVAGMNMGVAKHLYWELRLEEDMRGKLDDCK